MIKFYPKPVLTNEVNSAYIKECNFILTINEPQNNNEEVVDISGNITLNCDPLKHLIEEGAARIILKVKTNYRTYLFPLLSDIFSFGIKKNELERIDVLKCKSFIVSSMPFKYSHNLCLKDIYEEDYVFTYKKNELLGESNDEKLDYKDGGEPFIHICKDEDGDNKGLQFSCKENNLIKITVGPKFHEAYSKLQSDQVKIPQKNILNSNLAFDAILYALLEAISSKVDDIFEKEWFKALDYCYYSSSERGNTLKDFIEEQRNEFDVASLFSTVQKMLNQQIENQVIEAWRKAR